MNLTRQFIAFFMLAIMLMGIFSEVAMADAGFKMVGCNSSGGVTEGGLFPTEKLGETTCDKPTGENPRIFSLIVCNYIGILNDTLSAVYCALQFHLLPVLKVVLTLYIVAFGAQVLIGKSQFAGGDIAIHLLKIGGIWAFSSISTLAIGLLYNLFIGFTVQSIDWVLSIIDMGGAKFFTQLTPVTDNSLGGIFGQIDDRLYAIVGGVKELLTPSGATPETHGGLFSDKGKLLIFFLLLSFVCPPLFVMVMSLFWMTISIFARTVISFLMGISAVAFLIALSPIFLSFVLFKTTISLFENWLKYMVSYTLQPMITFAILALWLSISSQFMGFISDLSSVLTHTTVWKDEGAVQSPLDSIGFCKLNYEPTILDSSGAVITDSVPRIACLDKTVLDDTSRHNELIPPGKMLEEKKFIYFLTYHLITMLIISYAFSAILKASSEIARNLAGSQTTVPLGSGFASGSSGIGSFVQTFKGIGGGGGEASGGGSSMMQSISNQVGKMISSRKNPR